MTNILQIPECAADCTIRTNETWQDAIAFVDAANNPIALDGIAFTLAVRETAAANWVLLQASTSDYLFALSAAPTVAVHNGGTGAAVSDQITLPGGLVLSVGNVVAGAIASVSTATLGNFATKPSNPVAQVGTSGQGTGATFDLTWVNNALAIIMPASALAGLVAGTYAYEIQAAADGITVDVLSGTLTVQQGVVR